MEGTVKEIEKLLRDVEQREPDVRERAAAGQFLGSVYMGIENILERILKFRGQEVPSGDRWHVELFERFCSHSESALPVFFEGRWIDRTDSFRRFRHVVHHGYALELEWERMRVGLEEARPVFDRFREQVEQFLSDLNEDGA